MMNLFKFLRTILFTYVLVDLSGKIYRTDAALEKENLMFCYECNTMVNGKSCSNFTDKEEYSKFSTKCTGDRKTCMVNYNFTFFDDIIYILLKIIYIIYRCFLTFYPKNLSNFAWILKNYYQNINFGGSNTSIISVVDFFF